MSSVRIRVLAAAMLALTALPAAKATPVTWMVNGFIFSDGSTIAGWATYDAASNTYIDAYIQATGGIIYHDVFFAYQNPNLPESPSYITLVEGLPQSDLTNAPSIWIIPASPLTGPPGSIVPSLLAIEALCANPTCLHVQNLTIAYALDGELGAFTPVPEPSALLMFPGALLLFAGRKMVQCRRDRTRS